MERLIPYRESAKPRKPGSMAGEIWMAEDFDMLPDDIAESLGVHKSGE